jgi:hypothetical protein
VIKVEFLEVLIKVPMLKVLPPLVYDLVEVRVLVLVEVFVEVLVPSSEKEP